MSEEKAIATLDTPVDELEQKLVDETDIDELKNIINLLYSRASVSSTSLRKI